MKRGKRTGQVSLFTVAVILMNLLFTNISATELTDSLITQGNKFYMQRQYEKAEYCYARVLQLGYESGDLYFNLGNSYYKQKEYGRAILNYEKALLLNPGDEDIKQNLAMANARIVDKIDVIPDFFLKRWIRIFQGLFSPDQWAIISFILLVTALVGFVLFAVSSRIKLKSTFFSLGMLLILLSVLSFTSMFARIRNIQEHNHAIIMSPSVNARSSPDEQSTNVFVLHEGAKVMMLDSVQNWKEIRIANGNTGWVPGNVLGEI